MGVGRADGPAYLRGLASLSFRRVGFCVFVRRGSVVPFVSVVPALVGVWSQRCGLTFGEIVFARWRRGFWLPSDASSESMLIGVDTMRLPFLALFSPDEKE